MLMQKFSPTLFHDVEGIPVAASEVYRMLRDKRRLDRPAAHCCCLSERDCLFFMSKARGEHHTRAA